MVEGEREKGERGRNRERKPNSDFFFPCICPRTVAFVVQEYGKIKFGTVATHPLNIY